MTREIQVEFCIAGTQDVRVCVFRSCVSPVAAAGTDNPNGLQQEPELPTIPGL
jgi:hypothetical protein